MDKDTQLLQEQYSKLFEQEEDVVVVTNQKEWDQLDKQSGRIVHIKAEEGISVRRDIGNLKVIVKETINTRFFVYNNIFIIAENKSVIVAYDNSTVFAKDKVEVNAWDNSTVFAEDNVEVIGHENSYIEASDNVQIQAFGKSKIELSGNAKIKRDYRNYKN